MRERPVDIRDSDVAAALARQWALTVQDMSYLPVGFGGYHWRAADQTGSRWFVTVSDLASPWVPDLPRPCRQPPGSQRKPGSGSSSLPCRRGLVRSSALWTAGMP